MSLSHHRGDSETGGGDVSGFVLLRCQWMITVKIYSIGQDECGYDDTGSDSRAGWVISVFLKGFIFPLIGLLSL